MDQLTLNLKQKMSDKLAFTPDPPEGYEVLAPSGKYLGDLFKLEDGCFYFFPNFTGGCAGWWMRQIADKLDELNKPWEEYINETLKP